MPPSQSAGVRITDISRALIVTRPAAVRPRRLAVAPNAAEVRDERHVAGRRERPAHSAAAATIRAPSDCRRSGAA
jgi:hypothetical protein